MSFNHQQVTTIEFGVVRGSLQDGESTLVPVDGDVQGLLRDMVTDTLDSIGVNKPNAAVQAYEPSETHGADDKLALPLDNPMSEVLRTFYGQENRPISATAIEEPREITAYFCILHDRRGNKLVGIRRSAQFKAVLDARLIRFFDDSLRAVPDDVFKLDHDFDLIIDADTVLINRVAAFELLAEIDEQVQEAAIENTRELEDTLPFIEFDSLIDYVGKHKRAARLVAALRARDDLGETTPRNLRVECRRSGVKVRMENGKLVPEEGHEMSFLQMLDRRRYALCLIRGKWEEYEAPSRKATGVRQGEDGQPAARQRPAAPARPRTGRAGR